MRKKYSLSFIIATLVFFTLSCSQINRDAREEYRKDNAFLHGLTPAQNITEGEELEFRDLDTLSVSRGKKLYNANCMSCHGEFGHGDVVNRGPLKKEVSDISGIAKEKPNFKFIMIVSRWKGNMPGWKSSLTEEEMSDLGTYIVYLSRQPRSSK